MKILRQKGIKAPRQECGAEAGVSCLRKFHLGFPSGSGWVSVDCCSIESYHNNLDSEREFDTRKGIYLNKSTL